MTDHDRLAIVRDKLLDCQIALRQLQRDLALGNDGTAREWAVLLGEQFLRLEAAAGSPSTPAALFA